MMSFTTDSAESKKIQLIRSHLYDVFKRSKHNDKRYTDPLIFDYNDEFKKKVIALSILESIEKEGKASYEFIDALEEDSGHYFLKSVAKYILSTDVENKDKSLTEIGCSIIRNLSNKLERTVDEMVEQEYEDLLDIVDPDYLYPDSQEESHERLH